MRQSGEWGGSERWQFADQWANVGLGLGLGFVYCFIPARENWQNVDQTRD